MVSCVVTLVRLMTLIRSNRDTGLTTWGLQTGLITPLCGEGRTFGGLRISETGRI